MSKQAHSFDKITKSFSQYKERDFVMKKWIAPFLVLALAVLLIVCGKGITEKILEKNTDKNSLGINSHMTQTVVSVAENVKIPSLDI